MSDQATQPAGMKAITCSRVHRGEAHQAHTFMPPYQGGALYWCPGNPPATSETVSALAVTSAENERLKAALERVQALVDRWQGGTGHLDTNKFVSVADIHAALEAKP